MHNLIKKGWLLVALSMAASLVFAACGDSTATPSAGAAANTTPLAGTTSPATIGATISTTRAATTPATSAATSTTATTSAVASTTTGATATTTPVTTVTSAAPTASTTLAVRKGALTHLTLALDWVPNTNHTGIFVAQQKGFYKEVGIDLEVLPYTDGALPEVLVGEGKADLGISGAEGVATYRAAGQPVVSLAAIIQHNTSGFAYLKDSSIKRPRDLAGKRYAGFGAAYEEPVISAVIKADGGTNTKVQNITTNIGGYQAVAAKQADFVWIFAGWDGIQAKRDKVDLGLFYLKDSGIPDYYTPVIISSDNNVKNKVAVLKAFMTATAKGYNYAITNPKEAADALIAGNLKGTFTDLDLVYESQTFLSAKYKDDAPKWGVQTLKAWTDYPKFLYDNRVLQDADGKPLTKEPDYTQLFTNDLLPN